ncbi:MAG: bifunctional hydroxymethylpyrimidine kinase/phosphomethylpyrimidine kinase [Pseudonocardiales bacterium]|nr:bifunctional hydroxymethylpyrimidine kinase/phosphomethylpyrimidine kinase [Pseudonocardiales bacterium]
MAVAGDGAFGTTHETSRLADFSDVHVAVVGDLIADHYIYAEPRRLSREAPVIVLRHIGERIGAGGAANVARNLRALHSRVRILGIVGGDEQGGELLRLLDEESVDTSGVHICDGYQTPTKTRVLAAEARRNPQQVLRIDREPDRPIETPVREAIAGQLVSMGNVVDAVIISDYEYGLCDVEVGIAASELSRAGKVVVLDPRCEVKHFSGLTALTPNVDELARFTNTSPDRLGDRRALANAAKVLLDSTGCRFVLVTRGNLGMALFGEELPGDGIVVDAWGTNTVTDVCGAGDTAAAVFAVALAAKYPALEAMNLANIASGIVVLEHGAAVCPLGALAEALTGASFPVTSPDRERR